MVKASAVARVLGGEKTLGKRVSSQQDLITAVRRGLRTLPPDLREPLILCDLQGLPYEEAATILQVPLGTVKSRINRGRLELAKRLMRRRDELEEGAR